MPLICYVSTSHECSTVTSHGCLRSYILKILRYSHEVHTKHILHVWTVLLLLQEALLALTLKRYKFVTEKINYLGPIAQPGKIKMLDILPVQARDLKPLYEVTSLRLFLYLCNLNRLLNLNIAGKPDPFKRSLNHSQRRTFKNHMQEEHGALLTVQKKLVSAPVLVLLRRNRHLSLGTGACDKQRGSDLGQE